MSNADHMTPVQDIFSKFVGELSNHDELFDEVFIAEIKKALEESTLKESSIDHLLLPEKTRGAK